MNVAQLQSRLASRGFDPGMQDGRLGPRTYAALFSYMAGHDLGGIGRDLGIGANEHFADYEVTTPLRLAHFLAQTAHESDGYRFFTERWGPTPAQARYEGRVDLGNRETGDGYRFRGRGILQITGRANYRACGRRLRIDLEGAPDLAARPDIAVLIACDYWRARSINAIADRDDCAAVTHVVNGGENGLSNRQALTVRAKAVLL